MARKMRIESVEFSRTGKRSKSAKLETIARKQVRRIKYVESMPSYQNRGQN